MSKKLRTPPRTTIPSGLVIRALADSGPRFNCANCGDWMFVRYASGLCPQCFNGRRVIAIDEPAREVSDGAALAGVLDDPSIEELVEAIDEDS